MSARSAGRVLVVGGQGFLGQHILSALVDAGLEVVPTSRKRDEYARTVSLDLVSASASTIRATLSSLRPDVVVNCAGVTAGHPDDLVAGNVIAPLRLQAALAAAAPSARLIHLGSAAEYGSAAGVVGESVSEDVDPQPIAAYGVTKLAGTHAVLTQAEDLGVDAVVLRVFNAVGGGCPTTTLPGRTAHLLRTTAPNADLELGSLDAFRDFIDVRDVAGAVLACVQAERVPRRIYNVGSGRAVRSRDFIHQLARLAGHHGEISEHRDSGERSAALPWQQADIQRAHDDLGWVPQRDLNESLIDLWRRAS